MSNMTQIGKAIMSYSNDWNGQTPEARNELTKREAPWYIGGWRYRIQPYVKSKGIFICPSKTRWMVANGGRVKSNVLDSIEYYMPRTPQMEYEDVGHYGLNSYIYCGWRQRKHLPWGFWDLGQMPMPSKTIMVGENYDSDVAVEAVIDNQQAHDDGMFWPYHGDSRTQGGVFVFCDGHAKWMSEYQAEETKHGIRAYWWDMKDNSP
jgi:hypothetical protein